MVSFAVTPAIKSEETVRQTSMSHLVKIQHPLCYVAASAHGISPGAELPVPVTGLKAEAASL